MKKKQIVEEMARILKDSPAVIYEPNAHPLEYIDGAKDKFFVTADNGHLIINYETLAKALCDAGYRKQEWISVEERLPDKYGDYICCTPKGTIWRLTYNPKYKLFNVSHDNVENAMDVTHWMPFPEAPKMKGGAE